jgi:hypothetical protein
MAQRTKRVVLRGKVKWAKVRNPNKYGKWSVDVYPDSNSMNTLNEELLSGGLKVRNILKKDEDGEYMTFSRDPQRLMRGKMVMFEPPQLMLKQEDGTIVPFNTPDQNIGNGSDCDVDLEVYTWDGNPTKGISPGKAARLQGILVHNLVPFEIKTDWTEEEQKSVRGLANQPPMAQW